MTDPKKKPKKDETDEERRARHTDEANDKFTEAYAKALEDDEAERKHIAGEKDDEDEG